MKDKEWKEYQQEIEELWNLPLPKVKITYKNNKVEIKDALSYCATCGKPEFYSLDTLQDVFGESKGLDMYDRQNKEWKIARVEDVW